MIAGILCKLVSASLSNLQKDILIKISHSDKTASQFVADLALPKSTTWHNLRELSKKNLIRFGKGKRISLTKIGQVILPAVAQLAERSAVVGLTSNASGNGEVAGASLARGIAGRVK